MVHLSNEDIKDKINQFSWYHVIEVRDGIKTPGYANLNMQQAIVNKTMNEIDFKNKSVLNIRCRDGLYCFYEIKDLKKPVNR